MFPFLGLYEANKESYVSLKVSLIFRDVIIMITLCMESNVSCDERHQMIQLLLSPNDSKFLATSHDFSA